MRSLLIISDSDLTGISHKVILPSLKLMYKKAGLELEIIDLYQSQFISAGESGMIYDRQVNAYKHAIKLADHVHFITETNFGGVSPEIEKFFKHVLVEGYAYSGRKSLLDEKVFFYLNHPKETFIPINIPWIRLKFSKLSVIFKSMKIFQTRDTFKNAKDRSDFMNKIKNKINLE